MTYLSFLDYLQFSNRFYCIHLKIQNDYHNEKGLLYYIYISTVYTWLVHQSLLETVSKNRISESEENLRRRDITHLIWHYERSWNKRNSIQYTCLFQLCQDINCNIYACFIHYQKAFDKIQYYKMIAVLQDSEIDGKGLCQIKTSTVIN